MRSTPELKRILEVLFPEKTVHFGSTVPGKNSAFWKYCSRKNARLVRVSWPNFKFFNFPGTVLPFFYFGSTKPGKTRA
jgi:hypothetical protein